MTGVSQVADLRFQRLLSGSLPQGRPAGADPQQPDAVFEAL